MGIDIRIEDHCKEYLNELRDKVPAALEECGLAAEGYAKRLAPVDTGALRNSISHSLQGRDAVVVGTNIEYAPYVEMGTRRTKAQPSIGPSLSDHVEEYKQILEAWLKR